MALQSYTLSQLFRLELIAFRDDWEEALQYVNYELQDAGHISSVIHSLGLIGYLKENHISLDELENQIDRAVCYLLNKFDIK